MPGRHLLARLQEDRAFAAAVVVMALGVVLRALGLFDIELWADEARWAIKLVDGEPQGFRPVGYMWLTREAVALVHDEVTLRWLSHVSGVLALPAAWLALRRLLASSWLAVFGVFVLAVHPAAVGMSKEFKPYGLELFFHLLLVALALDYYVRPAGRRLAAVLLSAIAAPLFVWTATFLYPALFLVVAARTLRGRRYAHLCSAATSALCTVGVLVTIFKTRVTDEVTPERTETWGEKYDVFFVGEGRWERAGWLLEKTVDVAGMPAIFEWPAWPVAHWISVSLCALGIALLAVERRVAHLTLLVLPWLVTMAFNTAELWPYGAFRTNVFLVTYPLLLGVCALDVLNRWLRRTRRLQAALIAFVLVIVVAIFPRDLDVYRQKTVASMTQSPRVLTAMERIMELVGDGPVERKEQLILNGHACEILRYYRYYHPKYRPVFRTWFGDHFKVRCAAYNAGKYSRALRNRKHQAFWLIAAGRGMPELTLKVLGEHCQPELKEQLSDETLLLRCRGKQPAPPSKGHEEAAEK